MGICDVYHVWDENGLKKPSFVEKVNPDRVMLTLQIESDGNPDGNDGNPDGNVDGNDGSLTPSELLVMQAISRIPSLSAAKIAAQIGISKPSVERILRSLKEKKYIRREGSTRGRWIVIRTV